MAQTANIKICKNICILATKSGLQLDEFKTIAAQFNDASFTLVMPKFAMTGLGDLQKPDIWVDGARSGFLKVITISRRMSWSGFDLVIKWEQGGLEKALCFLLYPKPKIINKEEILSIC